MSKKDELEGRTVSGGGTGGLDPSALKGVDRRDFFAAFAMQGILTSRDERGRNGFTELPEDELALYAYRQADAMIKASMENINDTRGV